MHQIRTEILIQASTDVVWAVLTDFRSYGRWNPFIRAIEGRAAVGERLVLTTRQRGNDARRSQGVVLRVQPRRELSWRGRGWSGWLMQTVRAFRLDGLPEGGVRVRHVRQVRGPMSPLMHLTSHEPAEQQMHEMNTALKERAERAHRAGSAPRTAAEEAERADRTTRLNNALNWR
jgi:hypothetical protein